MPGVRVNEGTKFASTGSTFKYVSLAGVAERFGIDAYTVLTWIKDDKIKYKMIDGIYHISTQDMRDYLTSIKKVRTDKKHIEHLDYRNAKVSLFRTTIPVVLYLIAFIHKIEAWRWIYVHLSPFRECFEKTGMPMFQRAGGYINFLTMLGIFEGNISDTQNKLMCKKRAYELINGEWQLRKYTTNRFKQIKSKTKKKRVSSSKAKDGTTNEALEYMQQFQPKKEVPKYSFLTSS